MKTGRLYWPLHEKLQPIFATLAQMAAIHCTNLSVGDKGTKIKGILAPFAVEGSPELIEVGCEAGFAERNAMGFAMVGPALTLDAR